MNQDYYQYISQIHQEQLEVGRLNSELNGRAPVDQPLRKRVLLSMSDALLGLGQRIRPAEFQVQVQVSQSPEGTLEIKTGGC